MDFTQLKLDARRAIAGRRSGVLLVALAYYLILVILALLTQRLAMTVLRFPELMALSEQFAAAATEAEQRRILEAVVALSDRWERIGEYMVLAIEIMESMVGVGFLGYCLGLVRGEEGSVGSLFDAFGNFFRFLGLNVLTYLVVLAWSLLLVFPGAIALYRYSLAPYILMDDPDKSPVRCMRESREWMHGQKGRLFALDMSMLGWYLLGLIPFAGVFILPYLCSVRANFYRAVTGRWEAPSHVDVSV